MTRSASPWWRRPGRATSPRRALPDLLSPGDVLVVEHQRDPACRRRRRAPRLHLGPARLDPARRRLVGGRAAAARRLRSGGPRGRRGAAPPRRDPAARARAPSTHPAAALEGDAAARDRPGRLPLGAGPPDPLPLRRRAVADRGAAERVRRAARQRRDGERRPVDHRAGARPADGARCHGRAGRAPHRRLEPGGATSRRSRSGSPCPRPPRASSTARSPRAGAWSPSARPSCAPSRAPRRPAGSSRPTAGPISSSARSDPHGSWRGLLTGLHEPEASHLDLLRAVAGDALVARGYADVTAADSPAYLWHEFGDAHAAAALTPAALGAVNPPGS